MEIIRVAQASDAGPILEIYAPFIENTSITFETEVPAPDTFIERIKKYLVQWPWYVLEADGKLAGYAYASQYRERSGYQWSVEVSVYIHPGFLRRNIARKLYRTVLETLKLQGYRKVYAVINLPNDRSVAFHESMGFSWFATYEKVGYKLGEWKNVGWWQLAINEFSKNPQPPIPFSQLNNQQIEEIFLKWGA